MHYAARSFIRLYVVLSVFTVCLLLVYTFCMCMFYIARLL